MFGVNLDKSQKITKGTAMTFIARLTLFGAAWVLSAGFVSAHEAYVLPADVYAAKMAQPQPWATAFQALDSVPNRWLTAGVVVVTLLILAAWFWFQRSPRGRRLDHLLLHGERIATVNLRLLLAIQLFASAWQNRLFGPELSLVAIPYGDFVQFILFGTSLLLFFGFLTESAALIALLITVYVSQTFRLDLLNYLPVMAEAVVLLIFGSRFWSLDHLLFGDLKRLASFEKYEAVILRIGLGAGLVYAAIATKLLHPDLVLEVVNRYGLAATPLFPNDPQLIVLGVTLVELAIGAFIILGFETRLLAAIMLIYMTLGLFKFHEAVWPHLILYGICLHLLTNDGGPLTLDRLFLGKAKVRTQESAA